MNKNLELKVVENSIKLGRPRDNSRDEVIIEATLRQRAEQGTHILGEQVLMHLRSYFNFLV